MSEHAYPEPIPEVVTILSWHTNETKCHKCGCPLWFLTTKKGKKMPVQADGKSHFAECPEGDLFRKRQPKTDEQRAIIKHAEQATREFHRLCRRDEEGRDVLVVKGEGDDSSAPF